mgnify:CR=1 FL=1
MKVMRLGILGSGKGSNFRAIAEAISGGTLRAEVGVVVSDQPSAGILEYAKIIGVQAVALPESRFKTKLEPEIEQELVRILKDAQVDLVVLAGYMRMVKAPLLDAFEGRILNIHPSLLPAYPGLAAWKQALEAGERETGCSVHWVDAGMDTGEVIAQRRVPILAGDTAELLHARIQVAEHELYPAVLIELTKKF